MGVFDDVTILLGRGMDAADKKSQELKIQSELNRMMEQKEHALAELGRAVLSREGGQATFTAAYGIHLRAIADIEAQESTLRQQLKELYEPSASARGGIEYLGSSQKQSLPCPSCGTSVTLDTMYCPTCGDNLASVKGQYRRCPNCHSILGKDSTFCSRCGGKTVAIEVAPYRSM